MAVSVMIKPASSKCNLRCKYCFYCDVAKSRVESDKGIMSFKTAENVIKKALDFGSDSVSFTFQGGEPLLAGIDFFREFVSLVDKYNVNNLSVAYFLQTNATLIDEEWCSFFKKHKFLLGVSLDGNEQQNRYRVYPDGRQSFNDVVDCIELLKKHGVSFNIVSVLTKQLSNTLRDSYKFFKSMGIQYLQYIPCLNNFNDEKGKYSMDNDDYLNYLTCAFKLYYNAKIRATNISIRQFDNYCLLCRNQNAEQCGMNGICSNQFVVEGDGSVYPCDFYCTDEFYLGNINESSFYEMYNSSITVEFIKDSFKLKDECRSCEVFYLCRGGGCKRNRESFDYCMAYKEFFSTYRDKLSQI